MIKSRNEYVQHVVAARKDLRRAEVAWNREVIAARKAGTGPKQVDKSAVFAAEQALREVQEPGSSADKKALAKYDQHRQTFIIVAVIVLVLAFGMMCTQGSNDTMDSTAEPTPIEELVEQQG